MNDENYGDMPIYDDPNGYPMDDGSSLGIFALLAGFFVVAMIFAVVVYVISSLLMHYVFKKAGHKYAWSAWIPFWNQITFLQVGGIQKAWVWILLIFGASLVGGVVPVIGWVIALAAFVASVIVTFFALKGIQAGFGQGGNLAAVLGVIFTLFYFIWLCVVASNHKWDLNRMLNQSKEFTLNWFGTEDMRGYFLVGANGAASNYGQNTSPQGPPNYNPPQSPSVPPAGGYGPPPAPPVSGQNPPTPPQV